MVASYSRKSVKPGYKANHSQNEWVDTKAPVKTLVKLYAGQIVMTIAPASGVG